MPISEYLECVWTWNAAESRERNKTCPKSISKCSDRGFDQAVRCLPLTGWRCSSSWRCSSERWDFCSRCSPAGPSTGCWPSSPAAGRWRATQEEEEGTAAGRYYKNRTLAESLCLWIFSKRFKPKKRVIRVRKKWELECVLLVRNNKRQVEKI